MEKIKNVKWLKLTIGKLVNKIKIGKKVTFLDNR